MTMTDPSTLFQPIGEKSRREMALDVLRQRAPGDVVTYDALAVALDLDPETDRSKIQAAVREAARDFLSIDLHALEAVRGEGYRIVLADEHVRLGQGQQRRSFRALQRSHKVVTKVDHAALSPEGRLLVDAVARAISVQVDFNRGFMHRLKRQEAATEAVTAQADRTDAEVAELRERLARLEGSTS